MQFRKDINGLRALAVIAVVLFHFNASWLPGGFAGVDVFFVISGFLMTGIIFRGIEQENFSILMFYVARANRIVPALAVLGLVLIIFGWFYLTPYEYKLLGKHVGSSISFLSNVVCWKESGYFDSSSSEKWLLHTWSLSVEWQFYIIYPIVLVAMRKFMTIKTMKVTVLFGAILGFIFSIIATYKWPSSSYYLLPTRAWEMMIGGVAYLYPFTLKDNNKKIVERIGLVIIAGTYIFISKENYWPGYLAIFPVAGTFLVIQAQRNDSYITNNVIAQKIGAWSYSIYLWHWPLVVAIYYFSLNEEFIYVGIVLSVVLGFMSNKYIEKIKFRKTFDNLISYLACKPVYVILFVGALGSAVFLKDGLDLSFRQGSSTPQAKFLINYEQAHRDLGDAYWSKCNTYSSLSDKNTLMTDPSCVKNKGSGGVFLWGDSHSEALSYGIRTLLQPKNIPFYQKTSAGCRALLNETTRLKGLYKKACDYSNRLALDSITELRPRLVIIAQQKRHNETDWNATFNKLSAVGVERVLLVGPIPQWQPSLPQIMIKPQNWRSDEVFINDIGLDLNIIETDLRMKKITLPMGLEYVSLVDSLCRIENERFYCRAKMENGGLLQVDNGHLSAEGSLFVVNSILSNKILEMINNSNQ